LEPVYSHKFLIPLSCPDSLSATFHNLGFIIKEGDLHLEVSHHLELKYIHSQSTKLPPFAEQQKYSMLYSPFCQQAVFFSTKKAAKRLFLQ